MPPHPCSKGEHTETACCEWSLARILPRWRSKQPEESWLSQDTTWGTDNHLTVQTNVGAWQALGPVPVRFTSSDAAIGPLMSRIPIGRLDVSKFESHNQTLILLCLQTQSRGPDRCLSTLSYMGTFPGQGLLERGLRDWDLPHLPLLK